MAFDRSLELISNADLSLLWRLLGAAAALSISAVVAAYVLKTARPAAVAAQAKAAAIGVMLLMIYAIGEISVEGFSQSTLIALVLPLSMFGVLGLVSASAAEIVAAQSAVSEGAAASAAPSTHLGSTGGLEATSAALQTGPDQDSDGSEKRRAA